MSTYDTSVPGWAYIAKLQEFSDKDIQIECNIQISREWASKQPFQVELLKAEMAKRGMKYERGEVA